MRMFKGAEGVLIGASIAVLMAAFIACIQYFSTGAVDVAALFDRLLVQILTVALTMLVLCFGNEKEAP